MLRRSLTSVVPNLIRSCPKPTPRFPPQLQYTSASVGSFNHRYDLGSVRAYSSLLVLNDLRDNPGSRQQKTRKGRGIGSGKGKTAGRGHKGQMARGTYKFGFEGGQTPFVAAFLNVALKILSVSHFRAYVKIHGHTPVGLGKIAKLINAGKIDSSELITMKTLKDCGAIGKQIEDGVRLMGRRAEHIKWPIHLEVSRVTVRAKATVEAAGGTVRLLPKAARPPPKLKEKVDSIGRLPAPRKPLPFTAASSA
ncbi:hypothetical protein SASPL_135956 [Salvia splendens]|uniref:Large ribosomal subunit protein uL15/eL18 domain-containing protein n=1 Tax=Salvia splendens TaxID=180675 RepID=A0A8X8X144_SALSN|nr:hypothetical protein SASPL_135956 [Salvia splendens]